MTGTEDIAFVVELPEIYDGSSITVLWDGTIINRWEPNGPLHRRTYTQEYIDRHRVRLQTEAAELAQLLDRKQTP